MQNCSQHACTGYLLVQSQNFLCDVLLQLRNQQFICLCSHFLHTQILDGLKYEVCW